MTWPQSSHNTGSDSPWQACAEEGGEAQARSGQLPVSAKSLVTGTSWPTMNSLVRKALLGTKRRRGPFFTIVYLHKQYSCVATRRLKLHHVGRAHPEPEPPLLPLKLGQPPLRGTCAVLQLLKAVNLILTNHRARLQSLLAPECACLHRPRGRPSGIAVLN